MLGNAYINKIYARQCLHIISLLYRAGFSNPSSFFVVSKGTLRVYFKIAWKKRFFNGATSN